MICGCRDCKELGDHLAKRKKDVKCNICKETYHRQSDENSNPPTGVSCNAYILIQDETGGSDVYINSAPSIKNIKPNQVYIQCFYGSSFDCSIFKFGRKDTNTLEQCSKDIKDAFKVNDTPIICDYCIIKMIKAGEIKLVSTNLCPVTYPILCDGCDQLSETHKTPVYYIKQENDKIKVYDEHVPIFGCYQYTEDYCCYEFIGKEKPEWLKIGGFVCISCFEKERKKGHFRVCEM